MEEQEKRKEHEEEHGTKKESLKKRKSVEHQLNKERNEEMEKGGKMQDKWPKHARENRGKPARQTHIDHTQQIKHQLVINAPYTEYEASDRYVFISSNRRKFKQGGN